MQAEIWTKSNCSFCVKAKTLMDQRGISYKEFVIDTGIGQTTLTEGQTLVTREQLLEKAPAARTVPQIWLNDNYIGGYTELASFLDFKG